MSLRGSNSRGDGDTTLVTTMVGVAAVILLVGFFIFSTWLHGHYGKFFWDIR